MLTSRCMPRVEYTVLSTIEMSRAKGLKGEGLEKAIRKARDMYRSRQQGLKKDYYSHFILRLAFCRRRALGQSAHARTHARTHANFVHA